MARQSKLSATIRRVIATPEGTAAVHRVAMSDQGVVRVKDGDTDVVVFTRSAARQLQARGAGKRRAQ